MMRSMDSVLKLLTPKSVNGCLTVAHDGMNEVVDLDEEVNNKTITGLHFTLKVEVSLWKMERAGTMTKYKTCILFAA